jgi:hypothetical protein
MLVIVGAVFGVVGVCTTNVALVDEFGTGSETVTVIVVAPPLSGAGTITKDRLVPEP